MKKILLLLLAIPSVSFAFTPVRYVQISTNTLSRQTGIAVVGGVDASTITVSSTTFTGSVHIASNVVDGSNTQGTAGQSLQTNAGSAPTWVNVPSAILLTTSTWTANQIISSATIKHITGVTDGSEAAAGDFGEYISSATGTNLVTASGSAAWTDVAAINLSAGDWNIVGNLQQTNLTAITDFEIGISSNQGNTSTNLITGVNRFSVNPSTDSAHHDAQAVIPLMRVLQNSTTTYYLKGQGTFSSGTLKFYGIINARRAR